MATSSYLTNYGIYKETASFKVTFDIPNNCEYTLFVDTEGTHVIDVQLVDGEKDPSATFTTQQEIFDCDTAGDLTVAFELPEEDGLGLAKKPKMIINDLQV